MAVSTFLASGDFEPVESLIQYAPGETADSSRFAVDLAFSLTALRETYPLLTFTFTNITAVDSSVTTYVEYITGPRENQGIVQSDGDLRRWLVAERLEVSGDRIVSLQTFGPSLGLFASTVESNHLYFSQPMRMTSVRLTFNAEPVSHLSISAPAIVVVVQGAVVVRGNGVARIESMRTGSTGVASPGVEYLATPGDTIFVGSSRVVLGNLYKNPASLLATMLLPVDVNIQGREVHTTFDPLPASIEGISGGQVGEGISVEPLEGTGQFIESGHRSLTAGWAVLSCGGELVIPDGFMPTIVLPVRSRLVVEHEPAGSIVIRNHESVQGIALIVAIREHNPGISYNQ